MPRFLKRGMDASAIKAADAKVRETVEGILAQVEDKKDAAIRQLSKQFDNWEPKDFRLSAAEIEHAISQVSLRDLEDMSTAQVAQALDIEPAAVRQRVHRARLMLRGYLSDLLGVKP